MAINSETIALEAQMRECYGRVVWTHKTHEKCADILNARLNWIKSAQIILSAIITTGILVTIFGKYQLVAILTAILSLVLTIANTYLKQYDLGGMAQKHTEAAISLWKIREDYLSILTDLQLNAPDYKMLVERRNSTQNELFKIYKGCPRTFSKAYNKASAALKSQEELTFSDEEIDNFLPRMLRKSIK